MGVRDVGALGMHGRRAPWGAERPSERFLLCQDGEGGARGERFAIRSGRWEGRGLRDRNGVGHGLQARRTADGKPAWGDRWT